MFDDVPVLIGCSPTSEPTAVLAGCQVSEGDLDNGISPETVGRPVLVPPGSPLLTFAPALPARVAVFGGHTLLPWSVGRYAVSNGIDPVDERAAAAVAPTWWTACVSGSTDPVCTADGDADGWPVPGDCDDYGALRNPLWPDASGLWTGPEPLTIDQNCDGWPSKAFFVPEKEAQ